MVSYEIEVINCNNLFLLRGSFFLSLIFSATGPSRGPCGDFCMAAAVCWGSASPFNSGSSAIEAAWRNSSAPSRGNWATSWGSRSDCATASVYWLDSSVESSGPNQLGAIEICDSRQGPFGNAEKASSKSAVEVRLINRFAAAASPPF